MPLWEHLRQPLERVPNAFEEDVSETIWEIVGQCGRLWDNVEQFGGKNEQIPE